MKSMRNYTVYLGGDRYITKTTYEPPREKKKKESSGGGLELAGALALLGLRSILKSCSYRASNQKSRDIIRKRTIHRTEYDANEL